MRRNAILAWTAAGMLISAAGRGQWMEKKTLTLDGAHRAIGAIVGEAKKRSTTGVARGGRRRRQPDGHRAPSRHLRGGRANISIGKARTAAIFKQPTRFFEDVIKGGRTAMIALNDFTPLQGGVPIAVDGEIVGAVGVSGRGERGSRTRRSRWWAPRRPGRSRVKAAAAQPVTQIDAGPGRRRVRPLEECTSSIGSTATRSTRARREGAGHGRGPRTGRPTWSTSSRARPPWVTGGTVVDPKVTEPGPGARTGPSRVARAVESPRATWWSSRRECRTGSRRSRGPLTYFVVKPIAKN